MSDMQYSHKPDSDRLHRKAVWFVVFCIAPLLVGTQAYAQEYTPSGFSSTWFNVPLLDAYQFKDSLTDEEVYQGDYSSVCISFEDMRIIHAFFDKQNRFKMPSSMRIKKVIEPLYYNFEINNEGGMRLNLRYHF